MSPTQAAFICCVNSRLSRKKKVHFQTKTNKMFVMALVIMRRTVSNILIYEKKNQQTNERTNIKSANTVSENNHRCCCYIKELYHIFDDYMRKTLIYSSDENHHAFVSSVWICFCWYAAIPLIFIAISAVRCLTMTSITALYQKPLFYCCNVSMSHKRDDK